MQLKHTSLIVIVLLLSSFTARSQYYYYNSSHYDKDIIWEIGAFAGMMKGVTDIKASVQGSAGIYAGVMYQNIAGVRLELTYGRIAGADSLGGENELRNLSFRTPVQELAVIGEFHPLMLKHYDELPKFSPYVAVGLGFFNFNPQANLNGNWIDLRPLRTEGQGFPETATLKEGTRPYNLAQSNIIGGIGVKYEASQLFTVRAEFLFRKTFTDYLDDASTFYIDPAWFDANLSPANAVIARQLYDRSIPGPDNHVNVPGDERADSQQKDSYYTFSLKLGINLGRSRR